MLISSPIPVCIQEHISTFRSSVSTINADGYFSGRNGVQPTQQNAWGDWCNVKGTGFGVRPTTDTGDALEDAFVWVKPGGESDGTSDSSSARYDAHCGYSDALQPAPEAGTWFQVSQVLIWSIICTPADSSAQAYFAQLIANANPSF